MLKNLSFYVYSSLWIWRHCLTVAFSSCSLPLLIHVCWLLRIQILVCWYSSGHMTCIQVTLLKSKRDNEPNVNSPQISCYLLLHILTVIIEHVKRKLKSTSMAFNATKAKWPKFFTKSLYAIAFQQFFLEIKLWM
jgi:hypothetical protein